MTTQPDIRFAAAPDGHSFALRNQRYDSWFIPVVNMQGQFSDPPKNWALYVPATDRDVMAEELNRIAEELESAASSLDHLRHRAETAPLVAFARWLVSLDDPDGTDGLTARQTVNLTQIINLAKTALERTK